MKTLRVPESPKAPVAIPSPGIVSAGSATPRCFKSSDLFGATREIIIEHDSGYYRLRLTQANKLILTK